MNILVTAGNTLALIDKVRCITNIFTGRTGASIALEAHGRGHAVTLLTSHPDAVASLSASPPPEPGSRWAVRPYKTFEDLRDGMCSLISSTNLDVVIHCAAVSDYLSAGVYSPDPATAFDPDTAQWSGSPPSMLDRRAGKVKSDEPELWLRLLRAPKLIDCIRPTWGFTGLLVKFKLEVGLSDEQLLAVAERSRLHSNADLVVANTLEGAAYYAWIGRETAYERVSRRELATRLLDLIEDGSSTHGGQTP